MDRSNTIEKLRNNPEKAAGQDFSDTVTDLPDRKRKQPSTASDTDVDLADTNQEQPASALVSEDTKQEQADSAADLKDTKQIEPDAAANLKDRKQEEPDAPLNPEDTNQEQQDTAVEQDRAGRCRPKGTRFASLIRPISEDPRSQDMKRYIQHGKITTYDHCMDVAKTSYKLGAALRMKVHEKELVRGAFLHDYFLYDWHHHDKPWHGYTHPSTAAENADRDFDATPLEKEIIRSHMWPLTLRTLPKSREAVLVCIADKICSLKETLFHR